MSGTYDNRRARFAGGPMTASKKKSHIERAKAARRVLPGFPISEPFRSKEAVEDYFSGDKIICLRCGKSYRALAIHLQTIHSMTQDEYREFYGLPWRRGLTSAPTKERKRKNGKKIQELGLGFFSMSAEELAAQRAIAHTRKHRPKPEYQKEECKRNLGISEITDQQFQDVLNAIRQKDMNVSEVCKLDGLPSHSAVRSRMERDFQYRKDIEKAVSELSFSAKARSEMLGVDFWEAAMALRRRGLSYTKIGLELGVDRMSVFNHLNGKIKTTTSS